MTVAVLIFVAVISQSSLYVAAIEESVILRGDIYIGGLFAIQRNSNGRCTKMAHDSVMHLEAVKWTIEQLNSVNYVPGVSIGLIVFRTCGMKDLSAFYTNRLIQISQGQLCDNLQLNTSMKIVGIIGPEFNDEAKVVAKILGMLPVSNQLAIFGFSTTSKELNDKREYPTYIRTIPSDQIQLKAIHSLLTELEWNYITIIHENDTYNTNYANELKHLVKGSGICVPNVYSLHISAGGVDPDEALTILKEITVKEDPAIRGVVFIGSAVSAHMLLLSTDALHVNKKPLFIFSSGVGLKEEIFKSSGQIISAAKGALLVSPVKIQVEPFFEYWSSLFNDQSKLLEESRITHWLSDLFEDTFGCRPSDDGTRCSNVNLQTFNQILKQSVYVSYAIEAIYAFSRTIQSFQADLCHNIHGMCEDLRNLHLHTFKDKLLSLKYDMKTDLRNYSLNILNSSFDLTDTLESYSEFGIYNYQRDPLDIGEFQIQKVGILQNDSLVLQKQDLKHYENDGSEVSNFPTAQCEAGKVCSKCLKAKEEAYYLPGDYVIVVGISIRNKDVSPLSCSGIRSTIGLELALGAAFIAEKVNKKNGMYSKLFPNKTIGVLVVDTCNAPLVIDKRILQLQEIGASIGIPDILNRVLFFIGDVGSTPTLEFAELTSKLQMPHIGFASTTQLLSDKRIYPFFMRVSMSMDKQAHGVVKVAHNIGANYFQLVYSSGEYGESAKKFVLEYAKSYNICIAQDPIEVPEGSTYYSILPILRKKPHAKVVFIMLRSHVGPSVAKVLSEEMNYKEFTFIGAEAWGTRYEYIENSLKLEEGITFAQDLPQYEGYDDYLREQLPSPDDENPWLGEFFQKRLDCYFPWSFDKTMSRPCTSSDKLPGPFKLDPWIPYVMRATEAGLFGTDEALRKICGETQPFCDNYKVQSNEVLKIIRSVRVNNTRVFDSNGDGNLGYTIYNIQRNPSNPLKLLYKKVCILLMFPYAAVQGRLVACHGAHLKGRFTAIH